MEAIGKWAFIIGLILAAIAAFIQGYTTIILLILFILGLVVGFLNIHEKNVIKFLVAVITLLTLGIASINALDILDIINIYLKSILGNFIAFVSTAGLVVAIKAIVETSKSR